MGAARIVMTVAVIGIAAGAYLAFATVPSFAPYGDRRASAPVVINGPIAGDRTTADAGTDGYGLARPSRDTADEGFSIHPGEQAGTIVLQLPRWAQETTQWYAFGERALHEWRSWSDSGEDNEDDPRAPAYGERRDWSREQRYGGVPRLERRDGGPDEDGSGYADGDSWSGTVEQYVGPMLHDEPQRASPGTSRYRAEQDDQSADAAARAAERARDAARDVYNAEQDAQ